MLVLQRKIGETLVIDNKIKVTVVDISNDKVKLAIDAPKSIPILREELLEAQKTNLEASRISKASISALSGMINKKKINKI